MAQAEEPLAFDYNEKKVTTYQNLAVTSAGVESTAILANRLKLQWLQRGNIDARESNLYNDSEHDITNYIWITGKHDLEHEGDISFYVHNLNKTYPHGHLTVPSLKAQALVNLLDPFTYYSIYAWWRYVVSGKTYTDSDDQDRILPLHPRSPFRINTLWS